MIKAKNIKLHKSRKQMVIIFKQILDQNKKNHGGSFLMNTLLTIIFKIFNIPR